MLDVRGSDECWALGDEALRREPVGRSGPRGGVGDRLQAMADEMGVPVKTLRIYRGVANAWPKGKRRKSVPFAAHHVLRAVPAPLRYEVLKQRDWTTMEAREYVRHRKGREEG